MAKNTETSSKTQGSSGKKETQNYVDLNNGTLYNIVPARKFDSCSVDFYTQHTFDQVTKLLQAQYNFKQNANCTATIAITAVEAKKVVLTLYKTKKLLIQGSGTWLWRNTVFRGLSSQLSIGGLEIHSTDSKSIPSTQAENSTGINSPTNLLNKVLNRFKSPGSTSTPQNSSPRQAQQTGVNKTKLDAIKSTPNTKSEHIIIDSEDEITCVKQLYISCNDDSQNLQNSTKETGSSTSIIAELQKYKKANKELQETSKKLLTETKALKQDHEKKVLKALELTNKELNSFKTKLESSKKNQQEKDQAIKELKEKLAAASSDSLLFQEHSNKLKVDIKTLRTEKSQLVEKLAQNTGNIDTIEHKIESELGDLREALMSEIMQIKEQVKKSVDFQAKMSSGTSSTQMDKHQTKPRNPTDQGTVRSPAPSNQLSKSKSVFIAGDDMTGSLSSRLMSTNNMSVKIKTHRGGRIETIENSLVKLAEENRSYFTNLNAVILHAGAGNITDADTPDSIVNGLKDAAETILNVNPEARIIISSILPRRNDRTTNRVISETNQALKDVCQEQEYVFIDNDKVFLKDGRPDVSLYRDPLNLNKKGGKFLGQNMQETLHTLLHLKSNPQREARQSSAQQREARQYPYQDFRCPPNNRQADQQNRMIPPWMPFYPPWFPTPPQQFLQGWK